MELSHLITVCKFLLLVLLKFFRCFACARTSKFVLIFSEKSPHPIISLIILSYPSMPSDNRLLFMVSTAFSFLYLHNLTRWWGSRERELFQGHLSSFKMAAWDLKPDFRTLSTEPHWMASCEYAAFP